MLAFGGDPVAFSEVYRRYQKPIYGYCLARLMEPEAAADATQEVFIRFLDTPRSDIESPRAWLYTVARNVTIDAIRRRSRTPVPADGEAIEAASSALSTDAADEYQGREDARNVFVALRRLRPRYRTALILRELHHQSSADMADALDTTPGAVDTLVSRARDAFGRTYGEVADLPSDCRDAVASIYKRTGTGLNDAEEARLQSHLVACSSCTTEMKRATRLDRLSALLPFLVPFKKAGHNVFERAAATLQTSPELAARLGYVVPAERVAPALKVAAAVLAVSLITAPIVGTITSRSEGGHTPSAPVAVASLRPVRSTSGMSRRRLWGSNGWGMWPSGGQWSQSGSWQQRSDWSNMSGVSSWNMWYPSGTMKTNADWSSTSGSMGQWSKPSSAKRSSSSGSMSSWSKTSTRRQSSSGSGSRRSSGSRSSSGSSSGSRTHKSGSWSASSDSGGSMSGGSMSGGW